MDPVTLFTAATAAYNGLKRVVELGREAEDVFSQLNKWAKSASDLRDYIDNAENKKPGLFDKIGFSKSESNEALDIFMAKQKLNDMEKEIYNMFLYGNLQHLGVDGYREFTRIKKEIRLKREQLILDQIKRRQKFAKNVFNFILLCTVIALLLSLLVIVFAIISQTAANAN